MILLLLATASTICTGIKLSMTRTVTRRAFIATIPSASLLALPLSSLANENNLESTKEFIDEDTKTKFLRPASWVESHPELPDRRRLTMFISPVSPDDNLFVSSTPIRDDFTSLASLGSLENVGLGSILPKGELQGTGVESRMVNMEQRKSSYYYDYEITTPDDDQRRHLRTIFLMKDAKFGKRLVTFTITMAADRYKAADVDTIVNSFSSF